MKCYFTVPLSRIGNSGEVYNNPLSDVVIPICVPYKRYLDSKEFSDYVLVVNVGDELDFLVVQGKKLQSELCKFLPKQSLEYLIDNFEGSVTISNLINKQLDLVFKEVEKLKSENNLKVTNIIYLEGTTNFLIVMNKTDNYLITDPLWRYHEERELAKLSGLNLEVKEFEPLRSVNE